MTRKEVKDIYYKLADHVGIGKVITFNDLQMLTDERLVESQAHLTLTRMGFVRCRAGKYRTVTAWKRLTLNSMEVYRGPEPITYEIALGMMRSYPRSEWSYRDIKIAIGYAPSRESIHAVMSRLGFDWVEYLHRWRMHEDKIPSRRGVRRGTRSPLRGRKIVRRNSPGYKRK